MGISRTPALIEVVVLLLLVLKHDRGDHVLREGRKKGYGGTSSKTKLAQYFRKRTGTNLRRELLPFVWYQQLTIYEVCTLLGRGKGEESRVKARSSVVVIIQVVSLWWRSTVL